MYSATVTETPASDADADPTPPAPVTGAVLTTTCSHSNGTPVVDPSDLRYSILEGDSTLFSIGESSGEFSVADQPFDYEEQPWYLVHLLCYLDSDPSSNGTGTVNVTIGPVNEYLPAITTSSSSVQLHEDDPVGTRIAALVSGTALFTYSATDRDGGPDGRITFLLTPAEEGNSSRIQQIFDLDPDTGTLTLKRALDVDGLPGDETFERLDLSIVACNEGISAAICHNISLAVFITADDDNDPQFLQPQYSASVPESTPTQTLLVQTNCEDEDKGVGSIEGVTFDSGTRDSVLEVFEVNSTGAVLLKEELDYENTTGYQFQLVCSDGDTTATTQVTVTVLPVNDNPPHFTEDRYEFSVERTSPTGHTVGQVEATDEDVGTGNNITYSIETNSNFEINTETGEITIEDYILSSEGSSFDVEVFVSDGEFSDNATVHISITGPLTVLEFAVTLSAVAGFILLTTAVILLCGGCCCIYIRATRTRYTTWGNVL